MIPRGDGPSRRAPTRPLSGAHLALPLLFLVPWAGPARAEVLCTDPASFNAEMAALGIPSPSVTVTFTVTGVAPADYFNTKGSLVQLRDTTCALGAEAVIKVYGTADPPNPAHPPGTLKQEYGNLCCGQPTCPEGWASPNPSAVIFSDGTEVCQVMAWMDQASFGYELDCGGAPYQALGVNDQGVAVSEVNVLTYVLAGGGSTWGMPNAQATGAEVCYEVPVAGVETMTVPVLEDVTASVAFPSAVYPDPNDLSVGANDSEIYLKFQVGAVPGRVSAVRLYLRGSTVPSADGDGAGIYRVPDNTWSETTLTWSNRPPTAGAALGRVGPVAPDQWVSAEVTQAVTGPGTVSLALVPAPTDQNSAHFYSKEASAASAAYLQIRYSVEDADGDGVPDGPDCDDGDPAVHPGATEACNGVDDDCDGVVDSGCPGGPDAGAGGDAGAGPDSGVGGDAGPGADAGAGRDGVRTGYGCASAEGAPRGPGGALPLLFAFALGLALRRRRAR